MDKCKHLIDISPYDPLCDHPCRLYGGGAVKAECETCQYRMEDLERENAKLRELARGLEHCTQLRACKDCPLYDLTEPEHCRSRRLERELGIEVDG